MSSSSDSNTKEQQYLRQLNKLSHKISKPTVKKASFNENISCQIEQQPNNPQQPPVYNINKNDFRELVQKLTGSPSHSKTPLNHHPLQTLQPLKSQTSRLHRIRPPPLAQVSNRPSQMLTCAPPQFSPLPPLPGVDAAADSPVTAYLRNFLGSTQVPVHPPQGIAASEGEFQFPPSPLPFGCLNSPSGQFGQLPLSPTLPVPSPK